MHSFQEKAFENVVCLDLNVFKYIHTYIYICVCVYVYVYIYVYIFLEKKPSEFAILVAMFSFKPI